MNTTLNDVLFELGVAGSTINPIDEIRRLRTAEKELLVRLETAKEQREALAKYAVHGCYIPEACSCGLTKLLVEIGDGT